MIHLDVHVVREGSEAGNVAVSASTDGAGWSVLRYCDWRDAAEMTARILAQGMRYAGADVRMTSHGDPLS